ncbi:ATP-binding protein [Pseudenhygromyxa sp. WMMC2535]|uniref:ATP-binding protein n=1 Tax=Pseudenhygromyxa sp. WMMC2535 TaxID=2712867 RepID=UPI001555FCA6|nr:ATP-binding protein [Pseudenhygromyxa sp. WMMC2535]
MDSPLVEHDPPVCLRFPEQLRGGEGLSALVSTAAVSNASPGEAAQALALARRYADCLSYPSEEEPPRGEQPRFLSRDELAPGTSEALRYAADVIEIGGRLFLGQRGAETWAIVERIAEDYERVLGELWLAPRYALYSGLLAIARAGEEGCPRSERRRLKTLARVRMASLSRWAQGCRARYQPMVDLLAGELAVARGEALEALRCFESARSLAAAQGIHDLDGLASESLARLAANEGLERVAVSALEDARASFVRWGAGSVVSALERRHGDLVQWRTPLARVAEVAASKGLRAVSTAIRELGEALRLEDVVLKVLSAALEHVGGERAMLLLEREGGAVLVAEQDRGAPGGGSLVSPPLPVEAAGGRLPRAAVELARGSGELVLVDDLRADGRFFGDRYASSGTRAMLCAPILKHEQRIGVLVLEHRARPGAFGEGHRGVLRLLLAQAAGALESARLYAALEASEDRWRSLVDGLPDVVAVLNERGRVEFVNHPARLGVVTSAQELLGRRLSEVMDDPSRSAWRSTLGEALAAGEAREVELCLRDGDQTPCWFMFRVSPIHVGAAEDPFSSGAPTAKALVIATEISARKGLEVQLRQQQRLESIGTLASGVAHEINNPVQGIMNYAELIAERPDDVDTVLEFAGEIGHESERVAIIVRNLMAFARSEVEDEMPVEDIEVGGVIEATFSLIRAVLRRDRIELRLEIAQDLPRLRCKVQQVQQVLMNLVTNARDAIVDLPADAPDAVREILVRAESFEDDERPWIRVSVVDHGPGIAEEIRGRIFDPFFTTKGRDRGTGLGLSVSHGIAADHGGSLWVESSPGQGARFHLDLPIDGPQLGDVDTAEM